MPTLHVPNLVCLQQFCSRCEDEEDIERNCVRCGKRKHSFLEDLVRSTQSYLCEPRPWVIKAVTTAHNVKSFDLLFILNRPVRLKWQPEVIMNGLKIMCK